MDDLVLVAKALLCARNVPENPQTAVLTNTTTAGTWMTVVSITGAGWLLAIGGTTSGNPINLRFRITIDNDTAQVFGTGDSLFGGTTFVNGSSPSNTVAYLPFPNAVRFKTKLLVEVEQLAASTMTGTATYAV